jgi:hypothetical protein
MCGLTKLAQMVLTYTAHALPTAHVEHAYAGPAGGGLGQEAGRMPRSKERAQANGAAGGAAATVAELCD